MEPAPFAVAVSRVGDHEVQVAVTGELDLVSASQLEETLAILRDAGTMNRIL